MHWVSREPRSKADRSGGFVVLVALTGVLATLLAHSSAGAAAATTYSYDEAPPGTQGAHPSLSHAPRRATSLAWATTRAWSAGRSVNDFLAAKGGAEVVRLGQAGEDAVRAAYNIGDKTLIRVNGRGRIPDGLTATTLSEVKNVASLSYTRQLQDFVDYARANGLRVDLYVRGGASPTRLSGPLQDAIRDPSNRIRLRRIP